MGSESFRLTPRGRACVELVDARTQTVGSLSHYLHDVLAACGTGAWLQQVQQHMPPRPLDDSLQALQALGLIEPVGAQRELPFA